MTITQGQAINAFRVLCKLENQDMDGQYALAVFKAKKALEPQCQFQDMEERKYVKSLGCSVSDDGQIEFKDDVSKAEYIKKVNELAKLEIDVDIDKKKLDISGLKLSAMDIAVLESIMEIAC